MAVTGYLEQAKAAAQRTFIPGSESAGAGQDDVASPVFLAWAKEARAGRCLDAALAMLAAVASQALHVTGARAAAAASRLRRGAAQHGPAGRDGPAAGTRAGAVAELFTARVFAKG